MVDKLARIAAVKKELKNNAGSLQLAVADIFSASQIHVRYGTLTREAFNIKSNVLVNTETRRFPVIKLTYTKSFGGTGSANRSKQENGSKEERERLKGN